MVFALLTVLAFICHPLTCASFSSASPWLSTIGRHSFARHVPPGAFRYYMTANQGNININEEFDESDFPGGISSSFQGAGSPRVELSPDEIPILLMEALQNNDFPQVDSGLQAMWDFAGGNTKFVFDYNRTDFISSAHQTAQEFPTSFYGVALYGKSWEMETVINRVGGANGWIATQVMKTISSDGRLRRWQWELRQNRRPPDQGVWLVETIGSSDRKGNFEADN